MEKKDRAIVTIVGKDHTGILAASTAEIAKVEGNIINVTQNVTDGLFAMSMVIEINKLTCGVDELEKNIQAVLTDMSIHVMHENIFNAMHTI